MKQAMVTLAAMLLAVTLGGCNGGTSQPNDESTAEISAIESSSAVESSMEESSDVEESAMESSAAEDSAFRLEDLGLTEELYPALDGFGAALPLHAGIRASLFGKTIEEVEAVTAHSNVQRALGRLLAGELGGVFAHALSTEQQEAVNAAGITLESKPIASEGLIFIVNAQNPVESMTQQQIRDIYTGAITNWADVGGNDTQILVYQRNQDAGSRQDMAAFMGDIEGMEEKRGRIQNGRAGNLDLIAPVDFPINSIGYGVYSYAVEALAQKGEIKLLAIDGIMPNLDTMTDGAYPLLYTVNLMYNASAEADAPIRKVAQYLDTQLGKDAIAAAGFVPAE